MEQQRYSEQELVAYVKEHGYPDFSARQLRRFREEKFVEANVDHPQFGGTEVWYTHEAVEPTLAVCRLLAKHRDFHAVRFLLWLEGVPIDIDMLKESIWQCTPFVNWTIPEDMKRRKRLAAGFRRYVLTQTWKAVRSNFVRKVLKQFPEEDNQKWFISMQSQLLYGVPIDFTRTLLKEHDPDFKNQMEEPADILAHGLQTRAFSFVPSDIARDLQDMSDKQLLSWTAMRDTLFAANEDALNLARERLPLLMGMFEIFELMGTLGPLHAIARRAMTRPAISTLFFLGLLSMETHGYHVNIETICEAVRFALPVIHRAQQMHRYLEDELPDIAAEILSFKEYCALIARKNTEEQEAYIAHMRHVYETHKERLDALWKRHPDVYEE